MKNSLKIVLAFVFGCLLTANVFAQIKTGGYKTLDVNDAGVIAAADFAAQTEGKNNNAEITLQSIKKAEIQTVAGTNYKLCLEVFRVDEGDEAEIKQFVQTIVFRNLKKVFTLKSWTEDESCGGEE